MTVQPHKVSYLPDIIRDAWWFIRGVEGDYYRRICGRCGFTGQAHWGIRPHFCIRFKPKPDEFQTWVKKK